MASEHIVRAYDEQLKRLKAEISEMGGLVEVQLGQALQAVGARDAELGQRCVASDVAVDSLERQIDESVVKMLALRQPMASDLRTILSALKIAADLERIGDYAANVGKRVPALIQFPPVPSVNGVVRLGQLARLIVKDVLDAFASSDTARAIQVWQRDEELDAMYSSLFRELLTYMMEDPRNITPCTHLLFIAKNLERIGDHATNIAETIHFQVVGRTIAEARPKGDQTSFAVVAPDARRS
ncbi:MAG: phosphate signaling complex protein PhoU [Alphaproteobacteria bacterium]|nr:phosphate signaling complex protein PhoU [Alphaproteobacteria bacterium]